MNNVIRELSAEEVNAVAGGSVAVNGGSLVPIPLPIGLKPQPDPWRFDPEPAPWRVFT